MGRQGLHGSDQKEVELRGAESVPGERHQQKIVEECSHGCAGGVRGVDRVSCRYFIVIIIRDVSITFH